MIVVLAASPEWGWGWGGGDRGGVGVGQGNFVESSRSDMLINHWPEISSHKMNEQNAHYEVSEVLSVL